MDKSGGAGGVRNDVAVAFPPDAERVVVVVLTERNDPDAEFDGVLVSSVVQTKTRPRWTLGRR